MVGYATVAFGGSYRLDPNFDEADVALKDLAHVGVQRIIMISETGKSGPEHRLL